MHLILLKIANTLGFILILLGWLASVLPPLLILLLIPWHFLAVRRGLMKRTTTGCAVSLAGGSLHVQRGLKHTSRSLDGIVRGRFARNGNWTESKMLEDALGLFAAGGREVVRLPESAEGLDALLAELRHRGIPVEDVEVSAPALLD